MATPLGCSISFAFNSASRFAMAYNCVQEMYTPMEGTHRWKAGLLPPLYFEVLSSSLAIGREHNN